MVDIYLFRHGHVDYTPPNAVTAHNPLTPLGREMAKRLAEQCSTLGLELLVVSPLRRTRETAEAILERIPSLPYRLMPEFAELTIEDMAYYPGPLPPEDLALWQEEHYIYGNTVMWERVVRGWEELMHLIAEKGIQKAGVVSHGGAINAILRHVLGQDDPTKLRKAWIHVDYASTTCIRFAETWQGIVWVNETRHVEDLAPVRQGPW